MTAIIAGVAVFVAVASVAFAVLVRRGSGSQALSDALEPYDLDRRTRRPDNTERGARQASQLELVHRLATAARLGPVLDWTERRLDQANLALRPPEALALYVIALATGGLCGTVVAGPILALIIAGVLATAPPAVLSLMAAQRRREFTALLPDALVMMASSLKAGYSFVQGIDTISHELAEPMAGELHRVIVEAQLGRPVEEALEECAERMESDDFAWAVSAVRIQREVGGNLAELLETVAETMTERERLRRDIRSLTAEGRVSAFVLGALPVGVGLALYADNPGYMRSLFHSHGGQMAMLGGFVGMMVGFLWMYKLIDVDV